MFPFVVADIGGTNARFALVTEKTGQQFVFEPIKILRGSEYKNFSDALRFFSDSLDGIKPRAACVAIAGPVAGDVVRMTNLDWSFSKAAIKDEFEFERFEVINDFASLAVATSRLGQDDVVEIKSGDTLERSNKAILGPGTGLGVAGLAFDHGGWLPIPSEGGHVNVSPASAFECEVIKAVMEQHEFQSGHVSAENLVSGPGLVTLYRGICRVHGIEPKPWEPQDITEKALAFGTDEQDKLCHLTLSTFCGMLGTLSGNLALTYGARGGVYLGGGILPRFVEFLKQSAFSERFCAKGVMSHYVENIPVNLISHPQTAFLGAAAWLEQQL